MPSKLLKSNDGRNYLQKRVLCSALYRGKRPNIKKKKYDDMNSVQGIIILPDNDDVPVEKNILLDSHLQA